MAKQKKIKKNKKTSPAKKANKSIAKKSKPVKKTTSPKAKTKPVVKKNKKLIPLKKIKPTQISKSKKKVELLKKKTEPKRNVIPVKSNKPIKPEKKELQSVNVQNITKAKKIIPKQKKLIKAPLILPSANKPATITLKATQKEPKGKFELEYVIHCSPSILFEFITTPSGLSEWFSDDVNIRDGIYTFYWDGSEQKAKLIGFQEPEYIRLQWLDKTNGFYFEFRIQVDDLTGDVSLMVSDFAENEAEKQTSTLLWNSQINKLLHVLGSY